VCKVINTDVDCVSVEGWDRLYFHFFSPIEIARLRSGKWQKLQIRTDEPGVTEVPRGIVGALRKSDTHRSRASIGVYDADGHEVRNSGQFRGVKKHFGNTPSIRVPQDVVRDRRNAYYLGIDASRYGHFILETLCRAWAWKENCHDIAVIQAPPVPDFARALLGLIPGLNERVETLLQVTQFDHLTVPDAAFAMGRVAYQRFKLLCDEMAERALGKTEATTDQPLYLSRAGLSPPVKRVLVGEDRLERFLQQEGFQIARPETLSVPAQIALFNRHKWILSPNGSACHTRLFSQIPLTMIIMTRERIKGSFVLADRLCPGETHYANVFSIPELGGEMPTDSAQPVILEDERILTLLKEFGLVGSKAAFGEPPPGEKSYTKEWLQFARKKRKKRFSAVIEQLTVRS
jgi:hypothetical protein